MHRAHLLLLLGAFTLTAGCKKAAPSTPTPAASPMTNARMGRVIEANGRKVEGRSGNWRFRYRGRPLHVVTDARADRMRIMTPIVPRKVVKPEELEVLLEANFDRALDVKFALFEGFLWSVYLHPLSKMDDAQLVDAMNQVVTLADNYGTSYTSSNMVYGGGGF